jgi:hypothetical protein
MIVLTTASPDTRSTAIDITAATEVAALTLLPDGRDAVAAALTPSEARHVSDGLAAFAERHDA